MGRYLDLARRALENPAVATAGEISEISEERVIVDPYQELARAYLARICRPDYPIGLIPWLGTNHQALYDELTSLLPDEIHRRWVAKVPIPEFELILDLWLEAHRTACDLYSHRAYPT
jgi:hypothetical protein